MLSLANVSRRENRESLLPLALGANLRGSGPRHAVPKGGLFVVGIASRILGTTAQLSVP